MAVGIAFAFVYRFVNERIHVFKRLRPYLLACNIASLSLFSKLAEDAAETREPAGWEVWLSAHAHFSSHPAVVRLMAVMTDLGNPSTLAVLAAFVLAFLVRAKRYGEALVLFLGMG